MIIFWIDSGYDVVIDVWEQWMLKMTPYDHNQDQHGNRDDRDDDPRVNDMENWFCIDTGKDSYSQHDDHDHYGFLFWIVTWLLIYDWY